MFLIRFASRFLLPFLLLAASLAFAAEKKPVYVGLDAELGFAGSTSAQSIRMGMLIAMEEVNQAGGVLGGRPLQLIERDNKSLPARSLVNLKELAAQPDLVAVFSGRYSPAVLDTIPLILTDIRNSTRPKAAATVASGRVAREVVSKHRAKQPA